MQPMNEAIKFFCLLQFSSLPCVSKLWVGSFSHISPSISSLTFVPGHNDTVIGLFVVLLVSRWSSGRGEWWCEHWVSGTGWLVGWWLEGFDTIPGQHPSDVCPLLIAHTNAHAHTNTRTYVDRSGDVFNEAFSRNWPIYVRTALLLQLALWVMIALRMMVQYSLSVRLAAKGSAPVPPSKVEIVKSEWQARLSSPRPNRTNHLWYCMHPERKIVTPLGNSPKFVL